MTDPLADMVNRIRNGQRVGKREVAVSASKLKVSVCKVLKDEGYIEEYDIRDANGVPELRIVLKYYKGTPVIERFERISKLGRRVYKSRENLPIVLGGFGIAIVSTSIGVMSDIQARTKGVGGEVLCTVA